MRRPTSVFVAVALFLCGLDTAFAASWGFKDATISVQAKGQGVGGGSKETLIEGQVLSKAVELGSSDTLKILLTTQRDKDAKRPHQTYLSISDSSGLETSFPFSVKDSGKGKLELTHKDIPEQLLASRSPLSASIVVASFGETQPFNKKAFDLGLKEDSAANKKAAEKPLRYGKLPEIHHTFRADPKSPPKIITLVFTTAVLATLPVLLGAWLLLGANVNHLSKALGSAPVSHTLYFGSIVAMEGVFFMYYLSWNLFQTLPVAGAVAAVIFLSGSRALTEVQERRLAGLR